MPSRLALIMLILTLALAVSCATSGSNPASPVLTDQSVQSAASGESRSLWGVWKIAIDPGTWTASIEPIRGAQYTVDVVNFLQKPAGNPANLSIQVTDTTHYMDQGRIAVDVGLKHPFPGLDTYTGFDVMGVFMAPGTVVGNYDSDIAYTNGGTEPILENPDGYTRWMNPTEFPANGTILAFTPGKLGTPNIGLFTSTINGYKYFADNLDKTGSLADFLSSTTTSRGAFKPGSFNVRTYDLRFPIVSGVPQLVFQYAVVASWVEPDKTLSGDPGALDVPGDFPISANLSEAVCLSIADNSSLYYSGGIGGGNIKLGLEIFDWGALSGSSVIDQIEQVIVEGGSGVIPGGHVIFDKAALAATAAPGTSISSVYEIDIPGCTPASASDLPVLITVESSNPGQFDPGTGNPTITDRLAAYSIHNVAVAGTVPSTITIISPNGGETWLAGSQKDITWTTTDYVGNIKLDYSKDNFATDIHEIVASTPDTGTFDWTVPNDPSATVKVRATLVALPSVWDDSDANFTIVFTPDLTLDAVRNTYSPPGSGYMSTFIDYIKLDWPAITGTAEYAVYRSDLWVDPYVWQEIGTTASGTTTFKNMHTEPDTDPWTPTKAGEFPNMGFDQDYIYEVRARSIAGDPSSEFCTTQQALVIMESNGNLAEDSASWIFRKGLEGCVGAWGGNWCADEYYLFNVSIYYFWAAMTPNGWSITLCPNAVPDLEGETTAYLDYVHSTGPGYYIPPQLGWAPGTMSAVPTDGDETCFDFTPAPDSEYLLGENYNPAFMQESFQHYFGESNGAFAGSFYPWRGTRFGIPELLQPDVNYAGIGLAELNNPETQSWGYVGLDSIAIVVY